jgi:hypothetical protein
MDDWRERGRWLRARTGVMLRRLLVALQGAGRLLRPALRGALLAVLGLLIVFEEWGWRPLAALLGYVARWRPWAQLEHAIVWLPPYAALFVFVLPSALLLPLKFIAVFLVAKGQIILAGLLFIVAKVVATALVARLFMLTQPALMQIGWFAWLYDTLVPWKDALVDRVHASWAWRVGHHWKEGAKRLLAAQWWKLRPAVLAFQAMLAAAMRKARVTMRHLARDLRHWLAARNSI